METNYIEKYNIDFFKHNFAFALLAHKSQKTPSQIPLPYSYHLISVTQEVINAIIHTPSISYEEANIAIACALLHDVNEDTEERITINTDIASDNLETKELIVRGVEALTKNNILPKETQMFDSLARLTNMPTYISMVKMADRITNLDTPPPHWSNEKKNKYLQEAKVIHYFLNKSNEYLSNKLLQKIENYTQYIVKE